MKCAAEKLKYSLLTVTLKSGVTIGRPHLNGVPAPNNSGRTASAAE
jgi:hypothetical protein